MHLYCQSPDIVRFSRQVWQHFKTVNLNLRIHVCPKSYRSCIRNLKTRKTRENVNWEQRWQTDQTCAATLYILRCSSVRLTSTIMNWNNIHTNTQIHQITTSICQDSKKGKGVYSTSCIGNLSQSYGASPAIWDHTVLPATRHRWMRPALTLVLNLPNLEVVDLDGLPVCRQIQVVTTW